MGEKSTYKYLQSPFSDGTPESDLAQVAFSLDPTGQLGHQSPWVPFCRYGKGPGDFSSASVYGPSQRLRAVLSVRTALTSRELIRICLESVILKN